MPVVICKSTINASPKGWFLELTATQVYAGYGGIGSEYGLWVTNTPTNTWTHYAFTRTGNTVQLFKNGTSLGTATLSSGASNWDNTNDWFLGRYSLNGNYHFNGYMSNVRVTKNTRRYTSNFTPSTTPLTADANTVLLTAQSSTFVDNSSIGTTVSSTGANFSISTQNPFGATIYNEVGTGGAIANGTAVISFVSNFVSSGEGGIGGGAATNISTIIGKGGGTGSGTATIESQGQGSGGRGGGSAVVRYCGCTPRITTVIGGGMGGGSAVLDSSTNPYALIYAHVLPLDEQSNNVPGEFRDRVGINHGQGQGALPSRNTNGVHCLPYQQFYGDAVIKLAGDPITSPAFTVLCYGKITANRNSGHFYSQDTFGLGWTFLQYAKMSFNQADDDFWTDRALVPNTWHQFAMTYDHGIAKLYIDAILKSTQVVTIDSIPSRGMLARNGHCSMQELRILTEAKSKAWLQAEFDSFTDCDFVVVGEEVEN